MRRKARTHSEAALADVLAEFAALQRRVYHLIGNHCLYNFPRAELNSRLGGLQIQGLGLSVGLLHQRSRALCGFRPCRAFLYRALKVSSGTSAVRRMDRRAVGATGLPGVLDAQLPMFATWAAP